jgi:lysophospholipase L1-like esterase
MPGRRELLLVAASIIFAGAIAEIGLRLAGVSYPIFHRLETLRGWSPQPGISGLWMTEGEAYIENNDEGFRDRNHTVDKPAGTFRIAVIGDSMSEALAVPIEKTYPSILERELSTCRGKNVEVLNFSVSGYGTAQQLLTLRQNVLKYKPDVVLLAFFTGNDVWNNERALDGHEDRVYFVLDNGTLKLDDSNTQTNRFKTKMVWRGAINTMVNGSRLFQLTREFYTRTKLMLRSKKQTEAMVFDPASRDYEVFKPPISQEWKRAWATTEAILIAMRDQARKKDAVFWIANLVAPAQVYPDRKIRQEFARALNVSDLDYPDRRIADFAKQNGISAVTLLGPLRNHADKNNTYLHGFKNTRLGTGHWNETGHRIAGQYLGEALCGAVAPKQ